MMPPICPFRPRGGLALTRAKDFTPLSGHFGCPCSAVPLITRMAGGTGFAFIRVAHLSRLAKGGAFLLAVPSLLFVNLLCGPVLFSLRICPSVQ